MSCCTACCPVLCRRFEPAVHADGAVLVSMFLCVSFVGVLSLAMCVRRWCWRSLTRRQQAQEDQARQVKQPRLQQLLILAERI